MPSFPNRGGIVARRSFNPAHIPTPDAVRARIEHHRSLARQLRVLLTFSIRVHGEPQQNAQQRKVVADAR